MFAIVFFIAIHAFMFGLGFVLSLLGVLLSIRLAKHYDVLARPSERGSHSHNIPRLGGLGLAFGYMVGLLLIARITSPSGFLGLSGVLGFWFFALIVGSIWALIGGFLDDVLDLPASNKFLFQFAAALSVAMLGGGLHQIAIPGYGIIALPYFAAFLLTCMLILFWINAFNFMDGMDGNAAGFALVVCAAIPVFLFAPTMVAGSNPFYPLMYQLASGYPISLLAALSAGCCLGLLYQNHPWVPPNEKTFMGDSGSHFLGLIMMGILIAASQVPGRPERTPSVPLLAGFILLLPFLYDVTITLIRRFLRGENIFQAHRSHLYQRLLVQGWSHGQTLILNMVVWLTCAAIAYLYVLASKTHLGNTVQQVTLLLTALSVMVTYHLLVNIVERSRT